MLVVSALLRSLLIGCLSPANGKSSLVFGTEKGRISKRTGADKRTSGWPFKNEEADRKKGKKRL